MKLPVRNIPLCRFAALANVALGFFFLLVFYSTVGRSVRVRGPLDLMSLSNYLLGMPSCAVIVCAGGLMFRREWGRLGSVFSVLALLFLILFAGIHSIARHEHTPFGAVQTAFLLTCIVVGLFADVLFLINKPLVDEVRIAQSA